MTRLLMLSASLVFSIAVAGCSMPDGMNDNCEWPSEPATALDLRNPAHARHLVDDVRVAEELAIRYDDLRPAGGPAAPDKPRTRDDCDTKLFNEIAHAHAVGLADVREARQRLARGEWDPAIYLSFVALYGLAAFAIARRIRNRFSWSDEKPATIAATLFASAAVSVPSVTLSHLWAGLVEMIRVGDTHMSYRAGRLGWHGHETEVFALGVVLFWSIVLVYYQVAPADGKASTALGSESTRC